MRLATVLLAGAALVGATSAANATFTVYTTQAAFLAAVTAAGTDTYTGFSITGSTPSPITRTAGAYTYTATATASVLNPTDLGTFYGAGTTANPWLSTNSADSAVVFSGFSSTVRAIGGNFFGSDVLGAFASGDIIVTAVDATGTSSQTITGATTSSFRGFVSTGGLTSLTVRSVQPTSGPLWPTIDNLTLAQAPAVGAVPEPASWAMMIVGFGMIGFGMRYSVRKSNAKFDLKVKRIAAGLEV